MLSNCIILTLFLMASQTFAQDERYYRKMISGELIKKSEFEDGVKKIKVSGDAYLIDLNDDGIEERIIPQKRDGVDWLEIQNSSQKVIFSGKLFTMGANGHIFRIKKVSLNSKVKVLILFLDEGITKGRKLESQGVIYLLSYENNDLSTLKLTRGSRFYHEMQGQRDQYFRRAYNVNVYDIDKDGDREIVVEYQHIQRVFKYAGHGEWLTF